MTDPEPIVIGAEASCTDGVCGDVSRVVVDPIARTVTHVVVEPKHRRGLGRLVPLGLVKSTPDDVHIACSLEAFAALPAAEETEMLPGTGGYLGYGPGQALSWPYYGLGGYGLGGGVAMGGLGTGVANVSQPVTYDTLPLGEVAVRRNAPVHASDGEIGRVQGLVVDRATRQVTHVLLQEGHLWGRKEVAIPIGSVTNVGDEGISLGLTKAEIQDLPAVDVENLTTAV